MVSVLNSVDHRMLRREKLLFILFINITLCNFINPRYYLKLIIEQENEKIETVREHNGTESQDVDNARENEKLDEMPSGGS